MNLRALDLNLLVVLQAVLEEGHVTRAARRLALSQPATSSALERCRHVFRDPLIERVGATMRLTPKGQSLRAPLAQALQAVREVVDARPADLSRLKQTVRIATADQPGVLLLAQLLPQLARTAPLVDLVVLPWRGAAEALQRLESGEADLAVSVFPVLGPQFRRTELLQERYVVAMRAGHPAARRFSLQKWLAFPHVLVSGQGDTRGPLDEALAEQGLVRRVGAVVPTFLMVEPLLQACDLIAMLPERCLSPAGRSGLAVFEPPLAVPGFALHLATHARKDGDAAVQHVAALVQACLRDAARPSRRKPRRPTG